MVIHVHAKKVIEEPKERFLYVVSQEKRTKIKIGVSSDIYKRILAMETGNPCRLKLLCWSMNKYDLERGVHMAMRRFKVKGGWFHFNDKSWNTLKYAIEKFGGRIENPQYYYDCFHNSK